MFPADYSKGFGGKYGVQKDGQDKSAVGWDHKEQLQQHPSQKGSPSTNPGSQHIMSVYDAAD